MCIRDSRHTELLLAGGLYAELYNTQFAEQATGEEEPVSYTHLDVYKRQTASNLVGSGLG